MLKKNYFGLCETVYESVDDVDLWVGGLAEEPSGEIGIMPGPVIPVTCYLNPQSKQ